MGCRGSNTVVAVMVIKDCMPEYGAESVKEITVIST